MDGEKPQHPVRRLIKRLAEWPSFLAVLLGLVTAWICKEAIAQLIHPSLVNAKNSLLINFTAFLLGFLFFSLIYLVLFTCIPKMTKRLPHSQPINLMINLTTPTRLKVILVILSAGLVTIFLANNVYPHIDTSTWTYINPKIIPVMEPIGNDFRVGLYRPPQLLLSGEPIYEMKEDFTSPTQYPPLLNLLYLPFQLFTEDQAYLLHVFFLILLNLACLGLVTFLVRETILPLTGFTPQINTLISLFLFIFMSFFTFSGYPFLFSIERGNNDITALFFVLLAIYSLIRKPDRLWVQVVLLSIAVHLKIYPAVLFIPLLVKHGKKLILPAIIVNLVFLLVLGPQNALLFLQIITHSGAAGFTWVGNHSAFSFATYLSWIYTAIAGNVNLLRNLFTMLPIVLWSCSIFRVIKQKFSDMNILIMLMISLPLMDVLPPISHDYKSVILAPSLIILLTILMVKIIRHSNFWDYVQIILVWGIMLFLGRSFALNQESLVMINNKYLLIVSLSVLTLINSTISVDDPKKVMAASVN